MANSGKKFELIGGKELAQRMKGVEGKLDILAVRRGGIVALKPTLDAARANVPVASGMTKLHLSRGSRYDKKEKKVVHFVGTIKMHRKKSERLGIEGDAWWSKFSELGTKKQRAQGWLKRAFHDTAPEVLNRYVPEVGKQITKALAKGK